MKKSILFSCGLLLFFTTGAQQQMTIHGNLQVHPGTTMTFFGDLANNGTFTDNGQNISFSGAVAQNISGTATTNFNNLTIYNTTGVSLQRAVLVNNVLTLTSGPLYLNTYTLTVNNTATTAIIRTSGYIVSEQTDNSGKLKWWMNTTTGVHIFPFGTTSGTYIPFVFDLTAGNIGHVTVSTYHTATNNMPYPTIPVAVTALNNAFGADNSANVVDRFWQIDKDGISGEATLTFTTTAAEASSIIDLKAQRWNSTTLGWDAPLTGQTNTVNSATVPNVSTFSPWTLSGNFSSLPIELLSFTAVPVDNTVVDLKWSTATETNNDFFTIERSVDGTSFETVAVIDGAGNSVSQLSYKTTDENPYRGISYYRLKQTDMNGDYTYSAIEAVNLTATNEVLLTVYPNPGNGKNLNIGLSAPKDQDAEIIIYNALGTVCHRQTISITSTGYMSYVASLTEKLDAGAYLLTAIFNNGNSPTLTKKFIVQ